MDFPWFEWDIFAVAILASVLTMLALRYVFGGITHEEYRKKYPRPDKPKG